MQGIIANLKQTALIIGLVTKFDGVGQKATDIRIRNLGGFLSKLDLEKYWPKNAYDNVDAQE